jgi:hypothetical protein
MTVAQARKLEDQLTTEELVLFLSAPEHRDVGEITDPVAIFGTAEIRTGTSPRSSSASRS